MIRNGIQMVKRHVAILLDSEEIVERKRGREREREVEKERERDRGREGDRGTERGTWNLKFL